MAKEIKHIGRVTNTGDKVAVVFRTVPGESDKALVLHTATLPDEYHDALFNVIDSDQGQQSNELGEIMFTRTFPDGRPMLLAMQADGRLRKENTDNVTMTPTPNNEIKLSELNSLIAEQRNMAVDELYTLVSGAPKAGQDAAQPVAEVSEANTQTLPSDEPVDATGEGVLSDKDLAKSYRSQADAMYKEAARLRREAEELDPTVKKSSKKTETA